MRGFWYYYKTQRILAYYSSDTNTSTSHKYIGIRIICPWLFQISNHFFFSTISLSVIPLSSLRLLFSFLLTSPASLTLLPCPVTHSKEEIGFLNSSSLSSPNFSFPSILATPPQNYFSKDYDQPASDFRNIFNDPKLDLLQWSSEVIMTLTYIQWLSKVIRTRQIIDLFQVTGKVVDLFHGTEKVIDFLKAAIINFFEEAEKGDVMSVTHRILDWLPAIRHIHVKTKSTKIKL